MACTSHAPTSVSFRRKYPVHQNSLKNDHFRKAKILYVTENKIITHFISLFQLF